MLDIWIPKFWLPEEESIKHPNVKNVLIKIPKHCVVCQAEIEVYTNFPVGPNDVTRFISLCAHVGSWPQIWAARIKDETQDNNVTVHKDTFGTCTHCGEINPYQSGPFLCYQCTFDPWR